MYISLSSESAEFLPLDSQGSLQSLYFSQDCEPGTYKGPSRDRLFLFHDVGGKASKAQGTLKADIICSLFNKSGVAGTSAVAVGRHTYIWWLRVNVGLPYSVVAAFHEWASPAVPDRDLLWSCFASHIIALFSELQTHPDSRGRNMSKISVGKEPTSIASRRWGRGAVVAIFGICHLNIHWKDWCWSWSSNTLTTWYKELTH